MQKQETQVNKPPPGYPTEDPPSKRKVFSSTKKKGERAYLLCAVAGSVRNVVDLQDYLKKSDTDIISDIPYNYLNKTEKMKIRGVKRILIKTLISTLYPKIMTMMKMMMINDL
ncbi:hypothetical protein Lal_00045959, partial [Lupinus albus]